MPEVTWWRDSHLIDTSFESTFAGTVQVTLNRLTKCLFGASLACFS